MGICHVCKNDNNNSELDLQLGLKSIEKLKKPASVKNVLNSCKDESSYSPSLFASRRKTITHSISPLTKQSLSPNNNLIIKEKKEKSKYSRLKYNSIVCSESSNTSRSPLLKLKTLNDIRLETKDMILKGKDIS